MANNSAWLRWNFVWTILCIVAASCGAPTESGTKADGAREAGEGIDMEMIAASGHGDAGDVKRLLERGASVAARDGNGKTALISAAYGNHVDVARLLIEAGADVNAKDETQQSAYLLSTSEIGDDPRLLKITLQNGADVGSLDSYNGTGLIRAAERGHVEIVEELLKTDIDVDHVNNLAWTALLEAIILGDGGPRHTEVVRLLVEAGADVNLADGDGVTPLEHARSRGYDEIAGILRDAGAMSENRSLTRMNGRANRLAIVLLILVLCAVMSVACEERGGAPNRTSEPASTAPDTTSASETTLSGDPATSEPTTSLTRPDREIVEADLVLTGGTLLDGNGGPPLEDAAVAIMDGRIAAVRQADEVDVSEDARVIDVSGKTMLPGFVNAHAHSRYVTLEQTKTWTRAGVTTIRDLSGPLEEMVRRKRNTEESGDPLLPRLLVSGPMISVPGGHPFPIYGPGYPALAVRGPEDARAQVNRLLDAGVDHVKIVVSGRTDTGWPELSDAEIRAITDAAHARGARVSAHVDRAAGLRRAVENGIDDAAHSPRDLIPDDLISLMVERDAALVPTIDVYENLAEQGVYTAEWNATTLPVMQDNLRRFARAGGTLALGDDFGNPGVELGMPLDEIEQWRAAGVEPMQIIIAATRGGAAVCGMEDDIGTLEPSKVADVMVVNGDPLSDIQALGRTALIVHEGEVVFSQ